MDRHLRRKLQQSAGNGMWERACASVDSIPDDMFDRYVDAGYLDDVLDDVMDYFMDDYEDEEEWLDERVSEDELVEESDREDLAEVEAQENLAIKIGWRYNGRIRIDTRLA
ncbi:unnamed protein product [Blepharisma stoltei]|uniref:Uncharacterized protein n=1 Tax=Blepharisma stoltei TaxID=1481888 RepID=A0AAU9K996_9CILI|nr:unnamed protein product [Blepharisma stoltei]